MLKVRKFIESTELRDLLVVAVATGGLFYFGVQIALLFVNPVEKIAFFWPSNAIAAAVLIFAPRRNWPVILLAVVVGYLAARGPAGSLPYTVLAGFSIANLFEITTVAFLFRSLWKKDISLDTIAAFLPFLLIACVMASVLSGVIGAFVVSQLLQGAAFPRAFVVWFSGDLSGLALLLPPLVMLLMSEAGGRRFALPAVDLRNGMWVTVVLAAATAAVFVWAPADWNPWLFVPFLILCGLLWVAIRVNVVWTIVGTALAGMTEIIATFVGFGLFRFGDISITDEVVLMKAAISVMTLAVLLVAANSQAASVEREQLG